MKIFLCLFLFVLISFCFCSTSFAEENLFGNPFEDINKHSLEEDDDSMSRWMEEDDDSMSRRMKEDVNSLEEDDVTSHAGNPYDVWFARNAYNKDLDLQLITNPCEKLYFLPECSNEPDNNEPDNRVAKLEQPNSSWIKKFLW